VRPFKPTVQNPDQRAEWLRRTAPKLNITVPRTAYRVATAALRAVDRDIEQHGTITYETVEQVRAALALIRKF
jgi:hypothetical protein